MISIVIPTYDRPQQLTRCLASIARLDAAPRDFEVIVVDDGGSVPLEAIVGAVADRMAVTLVRQPHAGPAIARNTGTERAAGSHIAFIDDDCAPQPQWLRALTARFLAHPSAALGGRTVNALPRNVYSSATQLLVDEVTAYCNTDTPSFFASSNFAAPKEGLRAIGGFSSRFRFPGGEDRDLCDRWIRRGFRLLGAPDAVVLHAHALTLGTFWRQHLTYGRGTFRFRQADSRRAAGFDRRRMRFYTELLRAPFQGSDGPHAVPLVSVIVLSQLATATGVLLEGVRSRREPTSRSSLS